jgi:hypothetical protein
MNCEFYQKRELGEMAESEFSLHLATCSACQKLVAQDEQILTLAQSLQKPLASPLLWAKIENALRAEQQKNRRHRRINWPEQKWTLWRIAAVFLIGMGLGSYLIFKPKPSEPRLLAGAALQQVEKREREYTEAIAALERTALPQMAKLDAELMLLYRDRLETIDAQISRCKEALAENPSNAHIRRYLLAALQDKKETLRELVQLSS